MLYNDQWERGPIINRGTAAAQQRRGCASPAAFASDWHQSSSAPRRKQSGRADVLESLCLLGFAAACTGYIYYLSQQTQGLEDTQLDGLPGQTVTASEPAWGADGIGRFPRPEGGEKLLLASHNRMLWYYPATGEANIIHEGEGVYYGVFPGARLDAHGRPTTLWVVSRPHNWHRATAQEHLLELDITTGGEVSRKTINSRFAHDAAQRGNRVYICSTEEGAILELSFPDMVQVGGEFMRLRVLKLFTQKEHVNSVAPSGADSLWVILHNLGKSALAQVDLTSGREVRRWEDIGVMAHAIVHWRGWLLVLDSQRGGLLRVDPNTGTHTTIWKAVSGSSWFLKGLTVIDDVAYFGMSGVTLRQDRASPSIPAELAAFNLTSSALLWLTKVPTHGMINVVAAPHLAVASTYAALYRNPVQQAAAGIQDPPEQHKGASLQKPLQHQRRRRSGVYWPGGHSNEWPARVGGHWASGLPFLDGALKRSSPAAAGFKLELAHVDVADLKAAVLSVAESDWSDAEQRRRNAFFEGRTGNLQKFKHGVDTIVLMFSDQDASRVFRFPWYDRFRPHVEPILEQLLGTADLPKITRLQLARMQPGALISTHADNGGWARRGHRIHVPLTRVPGATFHVCPPTATQGRAADPPDEACWPVQLAEGSAFEVNNLLPHRVQNSGSEARIHLIVDIAERRYMPTLLEPGQLCRYEVEQGSVICKGAADT